MDYNVEPESEEDEEFIAGEELEAGELDKLINDTIIEDNQDTENQEDKREIVQGESNLEIISETSKENTNLESIASEAESIAGRVRNPKSQQQ